MRFRTYYRVYIYKKALWTFSYDVCTDPAVHLPLHGIKYYNWSERQNDPFFIKIIAEQFEVQLKAVDGTP